MGTPHPPPPQCMYLLNSGAETLFLVPGVPKQLVLPSNTRDSKTIKRAMDGKMQPPSGVGGMGGRKRQNLTLDLNSASPKKNKVQNLLTSPDVQMLKLTSPELEKFLSQNPSLATPTPSGYVFPKSVTEEQIPGELWSKPGHRHRRQHTGHPQLWAGRAAGTPVSSSPAPVSAQHLPLPH